MLTLVYPASPSNHAAAGIENPVLNVARARVGFMRVRQKLGIGSCLYFCRTAILGMSTILGKEILGGFDPDPRDFLPRLIIPCLLSDVFCLAFVVSLLRAVCQSVVLYLYFQEGSVLTP